MSPSTGRPQTDDVVFRMGDWLVQPTLGVVTRPDRSVRLEPKSMAALAYLARHAGRVVPKRELSAHLWPDTFVAEGALFRHVSELRRALGDDVRAPKYIQTIPKRGYRLVAPVRPAAAGPEPGPAPPVRPHPDGAGMDRTVTAAGRRRGWRLAAVLATAVVAAVLLRVDRAGGPGGAEVDAAPAPPDPVAYQTTRRGEVHEDRADCASYARARELYALALARDPTLLRAHETMMDAQMASAALGCVPPGPALDAARDTLAEAVRRGLGEPETRRRAAALRLWRGWDWDGALGEFRRAGELEPDRPIVDVNYAALLSSVGRHEAAAREARRALAKNPGGAGENWSLGVVLYFARRHDEAADQLRVTVDLYPAFTPARHVLALALMAGGRVDEAADLVAGVPVGPVDDADRFSTVPAVVRARTGRRDVALRALGAWRAWARDHWLSPTALALLAGAMGDRDAMLAALDEAAAAHDPWLVFLDVDPAFDEVRGDVRFRRLRARVGLDRAALVAAR